MLPLTADEAALLYHVQMYGEPGYPVEKLGKRWIVRDWRSVRGAPVVHATKRAATARFEAWALLARERWAAMRAAQPDLMLTAIGIRQMSAGAHVDTALAG